MSFAGKLALLSVAIVLGLSGVDSACDCERFKDFTFALNQKAGRYDELDRLLAGIASIISHGVFGEPNKPSVEKDLLTFYRAGKMAQKGECNDEDLKHLAAVEELLENRITKPTHDCFCNELLDHFGWEVFSVHSKKCRTKYGQQLLNARNQVSARALEKAELFADKIRHLTSDNYELRKKFEQAIEIKSLMGEKDLQTIQEALGEMPSLGEANIGRKAGKFSFFHLDGVVARREIEKVLIQSCKDYVEATSQHVEPIMVGYRFLISLYAYPDPETLFKTILTNHICKLALKEKEELKSALAQRMAAKNSS